MKKQVTGILAHVDAGKTTFMESLLFTAGVIKKAGRVDKGDAFLDTDSYEKERGITIFTKEARIVFGDREFIFVDTPGHVDFSSEVERVLSALDQAILIINGSDGVLAHTKTLWRLLRLRKIPTFIFVNKMDLPGTDKEELLLGLKKDLSNEIIDFSDLDSDSFFENVATASEEILNEFMENGKISDTSVTKAFSESLLFPVFFGSALKLKGIDEFLEGFKRFSFVREYGSDFLALCIKISKDKAGTRLTHLKLTGGNIKIKGLINGEKINEIRLYSGDKYETVQEAFAGDYVAVTGLKKSKAGLAYGGETASFPLSLTPVLTYAVIYPSDIDTATMHKMLLEIEEEDPSLSVEYNEGTKDIFVHLMGEVQTEILTRKIEDRFNVHVTFGTGKILYKETISDTVEGVGHFEPLRHYAEVHLKLEPLEKGSGLVFDTDVSADALALNWQRLILTHLQEREHRGVLTGSPITDMKITLVAGKAHLKHTEGGDFRQATYRAVRQGLMQAEAVLLEPFYFYELTVPETAVGKAMTDIDRMWGSAVVTKQHNGFSTITGTAPVATLYGYAKEVAAYTKGLGTLSVSLSGYEPCHNTEDVLMSRHYDPTADLKNTPDSVFCSHGAGTVIPWNEVFDYMHLPLTILKKPKAKENVSFAAPATKKEVFVTTEEIDEIIKKTAYANTKERQGAYKGRSEASRERQRTAGRKIEKDVVYKGTEARKKYMLIDGYNVVYAWKELKDIAASNINGALSRLCDYVSNYAAMTGIDTILVFDAYRVQGHMEEVSDYHNIKVVYTKEAETADHYIERYAHINAKKYDIIVVTSDGVEQVIIRGAGCELMSSRDFYEDYLRRSDNLKNIRLSEGITIS